VSEVRLECRIDASSACWATTVPTEEIGGGAESLRLRRPVFPALPSISCQHYLIRSHLRANGRPNVRRSAVYWYHFAQVPPAGTQGAAKRDGIMHEIGCTDRSPIDTLFQLRRVHRHDAGLRG